MRHSIYLASSSRSRYELLRNSGFNVQVIKQTCDESAYDQSLSVDDIVLFLAHMKMEHAVLPPAQENPIFVVTADTLCSDNGGTIYGKPRDCDEAKYMIRKLAPYSAISTGFCVQKKQYVNNEWVTQATRSGVVRGYCTFDIAKEWLDDYIEKTSACAAAGALVIDGYGALFLKTVDGSYSGIIGLPLCELHKALMELGFFSIDRSFGHI